MSICSRPLVCPKTRNRHISPFPASIQYPPRYPPISSPSKELSNCRSPSILLAHSKPSSQVSLHLLLQTHPQSPSEYPAPTPLPYIRHITHTSRSHHRKLRQACCSRVLFDFPKAKTRVPAFTFDPPTHAMHHRFRRARPGREATYVSAALLLGEKKAIESAAKIILHLS
jgi:hypothetical protein